MCNRFEAGLTHDQGEGGGAIQLVQRDEAFSPPTWNFEAGEAFEAFIAKQTLLAGRIFTLSSPNCRLHFRVDQAQTHGRSWSYTATLQAGEKITNPYELTPSEGALLVYAAQRVDQELKGDELLDQIRPQKAGSSSTYHSLRQLRSTLMKKLDRMANELNVNGLQLFYLRKGQEAKRSIYMLTSRPSSGPSMGVPAEVPVIKKPTIDTLVLEILKASTGAKITAADLAKLVEIAYGKAVADHSLAAAVNRLSTSGWDIMRIRKEGYVFLGKTEKNTEAIIPQPPTSPSLLEKNPRGLKGIKYVPATRSAIIAALNSSKGNIVPHEQISEAVFNATGLTLSQKELASIVGSLRRDHGFGTHIVTVKGIGYGMVSGVAFQTFYRYRKQADPGADVIGLATPQVETIIRGEVLKHVGEVMTISQLMEIIAPHARDFSVHTLKIIIDTLRFRMEEEGYWILQESKGSYRIVGKNPLWTGSSKEPIRSATDLLRRYIYDQLQEAPSKALPLEQIVTGFHQVTGISIADHPYKIYSATSALNAILKPQGLTLRRKGPNIILIHLPPRPKPTKTEV